MKVTAEFNPQAWVRDNAIDVDPEGPRTWDATTFANENLEYVKRMVAMTADRDRDHVLDNDDVFRRDPAAPEWVREWHGPFSIYLTIDDEPRILARFTTDDAETVLGRPITSQEYRRIVKTLENSSMGEVFTECVTLSVETEGDADD